MDAVIPCRCRLEQDAIEISVDPPAGCRHAEVSWPGPAGKKMTPFSKETARWMARIGDVDAVGSPRSVLIMLYVDDENPAFNLPEKRRGLPSPMDPMFVGWAIDVYGGHNNLDPRLQS